MTSKLLEGENLAKLEKLGNKKVMDIVNRYIELCKPAKVTVLTDSKEDIAYARELALKNKEELKLNTEGHTIHFDGFNDQGRDKDNTLILLPKGKEIKRVGSREREEGLNEVLGLMDGIMKGKEMLICFFCLGPNNSKFSIPALQMTDSAYVVHSETILYRAGYQEFIRLNGKGDFFHFVHSAGELDEKHNTKNIDKRRIYMDLQENRVFTVNNQYAGNSVGLKKLSMRLAINKSNHEDWLCEHMFIMGVRPKGKNRITYFTGAFPSACGKTSTAMIPGQTIVGDDIAYIRVGDDGLSYAVNVEQGIFGIIENVNPIDDPVIYESLTTPRELIFSNVLDVNGVPYWLGMGKDIPDKGHNFSGEWTKDKKDANGKEILPAHKNARYTIRINELANVDEKADDPKGVPVSAIIYGGRDSDTNPPVVQTLGWKHGVSMGAALESETTAATLGKVGERTHDPMANMDFLVVPQGLYIGNHLKLAERLKKVPLVFTTNYFLKNKEGKFLNDKVDKKVWILWAEGRVHDEYEAIETPIGLLPKYDDIKALFKQVFGKEYSKEQYNEEFSLRIPNLVAKIGRIEEKYKDEDVPEAFRDELKWQRQRLEETRKRLGDIVAPDEFK